MNKDLESKKIEIEVLKDEREDLDKEFENFLNKKQEEIRILEERLSGKDESQQISSLKKHYEKEIQELKRSKETTDKVLFNRIEEIQKLLINSKNLEKELEEKELLIEQIE